MLEGYEEHHIIDLVLEELTHLPPEDDRWAAKLAVAAENIKHHIKEDETGIFKKARKVFDDEELEVLGQHLEARRVELEHKLPADVQRIHQLVP